MPPIVSIVGRSESGKTTLIEKLIPELKRRGYRIGTIKHTHHAVEIDQGGKDSARHRRAGADTVMLASPGSVAMFKSQTTDAVEELTRFFEDVDLLITEGFKRERHPKIEVVRAAVAVELMCRDDPSLIAVATDAPLSGLAVPLFRLSDPAGIADFIAGRFLGRRG